MTQAKVKVYICIDKHGNYQAIVGSDITDSSQHKAIAVVEDDIKVDDIKL
jgi:hypothetical protein